MGKVDADAAAILWLTVDASHHDPPVSTGSTAPHPQVFGRTDEELRLVGLLEHVATTGTGAVALLSGPAGIGKTVLAHQVGEVAESRGFSVLVGRSNPLNQNLPYAPLVEAVGRSLRSFDDRERSRLVSGLPSLGLLLPGAGLPEPEPLGDPDLERTRLFEAVLRLLDRMSRRAPVLLLLDDLQWFDAASLELVAYLTRDLPFLPVLLLATIRSEDAGSRARLGSLLQSLRRTRMIQEMRLGPLPDATMHTLVAHSLGGEPPRGLVELVSERSGGIPLFAHLLIDALRAHGNLVDHDGRWHLRSEGDIPVPQLVRDLVLDWLDRLPAPERDLLGVVASAGSDAPRRMLEQVVDDAELDARLGHLLAAGLLTERPGTDLRYVITQPVVLEVAYGELAPPSRRALHARFAAAWDQVAPEDVDRLAHHLRRALPDVDAGSTLDMTVAAGERALRRSANQEAADHLEAAVALAVQLRPELVADLLARLGEARLRLGDLAGAVGVWEEAIASRLGSGDGDSAADLHRLVGDACADWGDVEGATRHVEAGLALLDADAPSERVVELLHVAIYTAYQRADMAELDDLALRVRSAAARVGTERAEAMAMEARGVVALLRGEYSAAERILVDSLARLHGLDPRFAVRRHSLPAMFAALRGDLAELRQQNRRAQSEARRVGVPTSAFRTHLLQFVEAFYSGAWDRADEVRAEAEALAEVVSHARIAEVAATAGVMLHAHQGRFDEADRSIQLLDVRIATGVVPTGRGAAIRAVLGAVLAVERGRFAEAVEACGDPRALLVHDLMPPWGLVAGGEALARTGQVELARRAAGRLAEMGPASSYPAAMALRLEGLAAGASDEPSVAMERLRAAGSVFAELGIPFEAARAGIEEAEAAVRSGQVSVELADRLLGWQATAERVGATRYVVRSVALLHALGRRPPTGRPDGDLTPRQLEIAELVAEGLSNAEVAERLFISVRTVDSHLDHIYTRLDIGSRAALAAHIVRMRERIT